MKEQLEQRHVQLSEELINGRKMLADLQHREMQLRETLLRISGAVQVLEEELRKSADNNEIGENKDAI